MHAAQAAPHSQDVNVDASEIDKFSRLAHTWWDPSGEFKSLHDINPLRLDFIAQQAGGLAGKTVLDVGCGGGILAEGLAARGASVTAIDLAEASLKVARLHLYESGLSVDYRAIPVETLALEAPASFDVVVCMEMLEHVPDPSSVVAACAALVKPGGTVCFSTLNRSPKAYALAVVAGEYILNMLPRGTHEYARFIKPAELARMARNHGLSLQQLRGMAYHPLTQRYCLSDDADVNYLLACSRDKG